MLASYVSDPNRNHSLDAQALDFTNHIMIERDVNGVNDKTYLCDAVYSIKELTQFWRKTLSEEEQKLVLDIE